MQNCGGTRFRSYSLNVSAATVNSQVNDVLTAGSSLDATGQSALSSFSALMNNPNSTLYYAEAPGSLGSVENVFSTNNDPGQKDTLFTRLGLETPAKAYAYFVFVNSADGGHGALILASGDGAGAQTPVFAVTSEGSGQNGWFTDTDFAIWMNTSQGQIVLRSQDIVGGDLADTLQLEVWDSSQADELFIGNLNVVQPI